MPDGGESRFDVKTMIYVIGVSYSAEYAIKGLYENTVGRLTEWIRGSARTPQDDFARKVVQDYAAFLYTIPWYKFPFRRKARWADGDLGADAEPAPQLGARLRARRGIFRQDRLRRLIQKALDASSDEEPRDIMFVVATLPPDVLAKEPRIKPIRALRRNGSWCRRRATRISPRSSRACWIRALRIAEIAGNHEILITVIAPKAAAWTCKDTAELFSLDLDARPGFRRAGLRARIDRLVDISRDLKARGASIEHFYDY